MGMLSQLKPAATSRQNFALSMNPPGQASKGVVNFMDKNPQLSNALLTAASVAFPPARAAIGGAQIAMKARQLLQGNSFEDAKAGLRQTQGQDLSLVERLDAALANAADAHSAEQRQRERG